MKIIQTMIMKVTTEQPNTCSKSTIRKKLLCLYDKLWPFIFSHLLSINMVTCYVLFLILFFPGYFHNLWCIYDLISKYYPSVENWPCDLWIEIFDKLRTCCWISLNFCKEILVSYLLPFWLKSKLQINNKTAHIICKVNVCYFWLFRV